VRHSWQLEAESVRASAFAVHMVALGKVVFTSRNIIALEARAAISTQKLSRTSTRTPFKELIEKKAKGEEIETAKAPTCSNVVNLMDALRASVKAESGSAPRKVRRSETRTAKRATRSSDRQKKAS
jgi:hypothetical protein